MQQMSQTPMQMQQMGQMPMMQTQTRTMQIGPPTGLTPLARSLPSTRSTIASVPSPTVPLSSMAGAVPAVTTGITTPLAGGMPTTTTGPETPITVASPYYTAGFLKNFIGKNVRVEFLLGTAGATSDRVGTLLEVGASYIVIQPLLTDDLLMCDLYSIRFVTIFG
jgi:hypothetical protein